MLIKEIKVRNYRSIECATLPDCAGFNVLIGKNNSGKSNILAAIETLFSCASTKNFVVLNPPMGRKIDFNIFRPADPIEITIRFSLSNSDWAALVTDIINDLPQVKNIIDSITNVPDLITSLKIAPRGYAWFEQFGLIEITADGILNRALFRLTDLSADELFRIASEVRRVEQTGNIIRRFLERFDQDDWRVSHQPSESPDARRRVDFLLRRYLDEAPRELRATIRDQMARSATYDDFVRSVRQILEEQAAQSSPGARLSTPMETFAGTSTEIPDYAKNLLGRIGSTKVLHLRERRNPIGPDEAARLLSLKVKRGGPEILAGIQCNVEARAEAELDAMHDLLHNRRQTMKESINAVTEDVERRWATEKMNIVPGSELLDCWYKRHGYRFLKMRDSAVLASLMQRDEIQREIVSLIEEIGSLI